MNPIRVVTDSTAYLPKDWLEAHGVTVVPLSITMNSSTYREGFDITNSEFYARLRQAKEPPTTSQPSAGEFLETYKSLIDAGAKTIISIHISGGISGTINSAQSAAGMLMGADITVVDSKCTGPALGFIIQEAVSLVESGESKDTIMRRLDYLIANMRTLFVVTDLMYLHKGGRLSGVQAIIGSILQIKPVLHFVDGRIEVLEKVRTERRALDRITELMRQAGGGGSSDLPTRLAIAYADNKEKAEGVARDLENRFPGFRVESVEVGPVIGTHVGPGLIGFQFYYG
ncbi:MAG TPA: DegV family protein [Firmicutes bacterium]|nr:DegV family protein [Bacillota bacterium]